MIVSLEYIELQKFMDKWETEKFKICGVRQGKDVHEASNLIETLDSHWNSFICTATQIGGLDLTCLIVEGTEKEDKYIRKPSTS